MNNYNTSTAAVDLEVSCFWDTDLSQMWFDDNIESVRANNGSLLYDSYRGVNLYLYTFGGDQTDFELDDLNNYDLKGITNKQLLNIIKTTFYGSSDDLNDDSLCYFSKYPYQLTKNELFELVENAFPYDYQEFLTDNLTPLFTVISSRGHCQGDYAEVIINKVLTEKEKESYQSEIDNLFWNSPIYCRLTIDQDTEFDFNEYLNNLYDYDKGKILAIAEKEIGHEQKDLILEFLSDNLPEYPNYC